MADHSPIGGDHHAATGNDAPLHKKYIPLRDVYSATSPSASTPRLRKPRAAAAAARESSALGDQSTHFATYVYSRKRKRKDKTVNYFQRLLDDADGVVGKRRVVEDGELGKLGVDCYGLSMLDAGQKSGKKSSGKKAASGKGNSGGIVIRDLEASRRPEGNTISDLQSFPVVKEEFEWVAVGGRPVEEGYSGELGKWGVDRNGLSGLDTVKKSGKKSSGKKPAARGKGKTGGIAIGDLEGSRRAEGNTINDLPSFPVVKEEFEWVAVGGRLVEEGYSAELGKLGVYHNGLSGLDAVKKSGKKSSGKKAAARGKGKSGGIVIRDLEGRRSPVGNTINDLQSLALVAEESERVAAGGRPVEEGYSGELGVDRNGLSGLDVVKKSGKKSSGQKVAKGKGKSDGIVIRDLEGSRRPEENATYDLQSFSFVAEESEVAVEGRLVEKGYSGELGLDCKGLSKLDAVNKSSCKIGGRGKRKSAGVVNDGLEGSTRQKRSGEKATSDLQPLSLEADSSWKFEQSEGVANSEQSEKLGVDCKGLSKIDGVKTSSGKKVSRGKRIEDVKSCRSLKRQEENTTSNLQASFLDAESSGKFEDSEDVYVKQRLVDEGSQDQLEKLRADCKVLSKFDAVKTSSGKKVAIGKGKSAGIKIEDLESSRRRNSDTVKLEVTDMEEVSKGKKWRRLSYEGVDPKNFVGLECKVFWPLDADWYRGRIVGYDSKRGRHHVLYKDEDKEDVMLSNEHVKFHVSSEDIQKLNLKCCNKILDTDPIDVNELMALAASVDDSSEIDPGDIIWAKLTGHAVWPAIVLDDSCVAEHKSLKKFSGEKSVLVQFFGTHDFARVTHKQAIPFLKGLISSYSTKCRKPTFLRGLNEAKMYLSDRKAPEVMLRLREGFAKNNGSAEHDHCDLGDEESLSHDDLNTKFEHLLSCPLEAGELQVLSIGKIVKDSDNFQNEKSVWPVGYTAVRKFLSATDPNVDALYKMEVLREVDSSTRPLFRITMENGEEFNGPTPSACWNKIYSKIRAAQFNNHDRSGQADFQSGSNMFGFTHPKVSKLIKEMSNPRRLPKPSVVASKRSRQNSVYRPVHVEWRDLDKCNVCHMDDEYENNLFLQCDKCRMMVHARCYGELEPTGGALWICRLCRPGAPSSPPCCLCPVVGGAMKPTTDGRWAHLACAIWIPETCFSNVKKMEPIDGLLRVNKDRWRLLCSICGVSYGACIQCSNHSCRVAYHPLCARAAGFCLEPEDVDKPHLLPDEDGEGQAIQLLSFCRRHRPSSHELLSHDKQTGLQASDPANFVPKINPSGCARTEPYIRRGKDEPEALAAALSKRMYVENMPYIVGGMSPHMPLWNKTSSSSVDLLKLRASQLEPKGKILSFADKYNYMKDTLKKRLTFGKSAIHGFGIFTKLPHKAGDMVIEYSGEVIRPRVADRREHLIYNSLVGAGTYMFRVDDERVVDATRAGSIAHLINHSCEPNCYSRTIRINDEDHIIIFSKRDIKQFEELTYDYRFVSSDERLRCYCGSSRCRGVVNDAEAEERMKKLCVPRSELVEWKGED